MKSSSTIRAFNFCLLLAFGLAFWPVAVRAQTPITCGQTIVSNTVNNSEVDQYTYAGTAGEQLAFALWGPTLCTDHGDAMVADIYSPTGQLLASFSAGCRGQALNLALTNSGTFSILVHDSFYTRTGSYALSIQSVIAGGCDSQAISCGQTIATNTTYKSEMDAYSYAGTAGQQLTFALWGPTLCTDNGDAMGADIYSPTGQLLANLYAGCRGQALNLALTNSGTFTILVHDIYYDRTGSYALSIQSVTGGGCDSQAISCGQTVAASTSSKSEMDAYSYAGTAGQQLTFALWGPTLCTDNGDAMGADIYSPTGQLLASLYAGCSGQALNLALTNSGIFTILVHDIYYDRTGSYALSIQSVTGGGCNTTPIACGQTVSSGISQLAEIDAYLITGCSNQLVQISTSGFSGSQFDLYDPAGNRLFSIGAGTASNVTFTSSGSFTLLVHSGNYAGTGSYSVTLTCILNGCSHTITTGSSPLAGGSTRGDGAYSCCAVVTVCAMPNPCYNFESWTLNGNIVSTLHCYSFTSSSNQTLMANFSPTAGAKNEICGIQVAGPNVAVSVQSVAGDTYQLQSRNSMTTGNWSNVAGVFLSNSVGGLITLTNFGGASTTQRFFRVGVTP